MNKYLYRIVFNKTRGQLMAVAEDVASDGKAPGTSRAPNAMRNAAACVVAIVRPLQYSILLALGLVSVAAQAQIVADPHAPRTQQPTVLTAGNGVPLVNIQSPSAAGVSRNTYSQFDVNRNGVVLNNSRNSVQSQLGGWVQGNPWLAAGTARVILNEVNSSNPSLLRGYVEVAGDRAQVVIANPAGISCDGCGFINANRATLTTGTAIINGGSLDSYRVQGGTVSVTGAGLDASRTDFTDIIARSVQVNAGIWANTLKVTTGANEVSADHTQTTPIAASGAAPAYGLDVASLGGMYAGQITLVGTESGVGVRNAGQIGASAGDVVVTADGRLENSGRITASGSVRADTNGGVTNSGTVYAQGDTQVTTRGNVVNSGTIAAQGNTTVAATGAASTIDSQSGSLLGAGLRSDGTLRGSGTLQLTATGQLNAQGQNLASADIGASGAAIDLAGSQTAGKNVTLTAGGGDVDATRATVSATQTVTANASGTLRTDGAALSADRLSLAAHDISNVQGNVVQTGTSDLSLQLPGQLDNTNGRIAANSGNVSLGAQTLTNTDGHIEHAGTGTLTLNAATVNGTGGSIGSNGTLSLTSTTATLDNGNTSADTIQVNAQTLSNRKGQLIQTGTGSATVIASTSLDNTGGTIATNGAATVNAGSLTNQGGTIQAAGTSSLKVTASGSLDNSAQGKITAGGDATVRAATLSNASGVLTAGGALDAQATGTMNNVSGLLAANQNVSIGGSAIDNSGGQVASVHGATTVTATAGSVGNTNGRIEAAQSITIAANGVTNTNGVVSGGDVHVDSRTLSLDNTRGAIVAAGLLDVQSGHLTNEAGTLQAAGALTIDTHGQTLSNTHSGATGGILGQSTVTLTTGDLDNTAGVIGAKGDISSNSAQITNVQGGQITGESAITLTGTGIDNRGGNVQALGNIKLDVGGGTVDNSGSLIRSGSTLTVTAGQLINRGTQGNDQGVEGQSVSVTADAIDNHAGAIRADSALTLTGSGAIDNSAGLISSRQAVQIQDRNLASKRQQVTNTGGTLIAAKSLAVNSAGLSGDGSVLSQGDVSVSLNGDFVNTGDVEANGNLTFQATGHITNQAAMRAGNTLTVGASGIDNAAAGEFSAATTQISAGGTITNRGLIDGQDTTVSSGVLNNIGTGRIYGDHLAISAGALTNDVENGIAATIAARSRLDIAAQTVTNREHALIFSAGDMSIGGALDGSRFATGSAGTVNNNSASIEALGNLTLSAVNVNNTNEHFATDIQQQGGPQHIVEYQGDGSPNRYREGDPGVFTYVDESLHLQTPDASYESWHKYEYDRTTTATVITSSDPGKITSGGAMQINASNVLNDKSQIIAGGALVGNIGNLNNTEVTGQQTVTDVGTSTAYWRNHKKGRDDTGSSSTGYAPPTAISDIRLTPTVYAEFTAPGGSGAIIGAVTVAAVRNTAAAVGPANVMVSSPKVVDHVPTIAAVNAVTSGQPFVIRSANVNTTVPNTSLFSINPNPAGSFLIETDPRFANYRTWLSSDYMLAQLNVDPALTQKRLGDGFYEQKLIREQVAQLTGRRFIEGYSSDEAEYRALIDNGVTYAKEWGLRPGIALTQAQMAQLTSDIVWLVEKDVTLPNGQTTKALVPQVYVRVNPGDLDGSGALISAQSVALNLSGDVMNKGTIAGRDIVSLTAENVKNLGGRITGSDVAVRANTDLMNLGGTIDAANSLTAIAGHDLTSATTTHSNANAQGTITNVSRVAGLYVTNLSDATLIAAAGHDLTLAGSQIGNQSAGGQTTIAAAHDLNLSTVGTSSSQSLTWDSNNWRKDSSQQEVGSSIQTTGNLRLSAGHDLNARGATATSEQGALVATAGNDVNLTSSESTRNVDEAHQHKGTSGWLSSTTITTRNTMSDTTNQGTVLSGNTTNVQSGNDINVSGSDIVSAGGTTLLAKGNVNVVSATNASAEHHMRDEKTSGIMAGGGLGVTIGSTEQKSTFDSQAITQSDARSAIGSVAGNVSITAGKDVHIGGSDVVAGKAADDTTGATGNIRIAGQNVTIDPGRDDLTSHEQEEMRSSGITVGLRGTPVDMVRNARADMASGSSFGRANGVLNEVAAFGGGDTPSISLSYGRSQSTSTTDFSSATHSGSTIRGGGNVSVIATGGAVHDESGKVLDGDITAIGSTISAGGTTSLHANRDVVLQASTDSTQQSSQSSSSSMGFSLAAPTLADVSRWVSGTANTGGASSSPYNASRSSSNGSQAVLQQTASMVSGNSVVVKSDTGNIDVIGSSITGTQGVDLLAQNGAINVMAGLDTNTSHQESSSRQIGSLGSNGTATGFSVGVSKTHMVEDTAAQTQSGVRSAIVSQSGNVTLNAKQDLTVQGSDLAAAGDLTLIGKNVNLDPGTDNQRSSMSQSASQYGVTVAVGGVAGSAVAALSQAMGPHRASDPRLAALDKAKAALATYDAAKTAEQFIEKGGKSDQALVKVTVSVGGGSSHSESQQSASINSGSNLSAGGTVKLVATGSGEKDANGVASDGDINSRGARITGNDVVLNAARDVNLLSAQDLTHQASSNSSSNASIGVGFALGGQQNGFTIELAASGAKGHANGDSVTNRDTQIAATNNVSITSGRDTNLRGAEVSGNTVDANVGRDLNIQSVQDTANYDSKQVSGGFNLSVCVPPICYGSTVSGSASASDQTIRDRFRSVGEQSGIRAGDGGFNIQVGNHTQLDGGVIASSAPQDKNTLSTQTFGYSNLQNVSESSGSTLSASFSGSAGRSTPNGVTWSAPVDASGKATGPSPNQMGPSGLGMAGVSNSASGTTYAAVSPATITVRGDEGTGRDSTAGLSRDVTTANSGALKNDFDAKKLQDDMAVQQGTVQVGMRVVGDIATSLEDKAGRKAEEAKQRLKDANDQGDTQAAAQAQADLDAANAQLALWGNDGAARMGSHAIVAGIGAALGGGSVPGAVAGTVAGDIAGDAASKALGDTPGEKVLSNLASGLAGTLAGGAVGGTAGAMSGANGALGADLYNRQLHQAEIDAIRKKAKQLADAGVTSYDDALERLSSQALRDVDTQFAASHPGADVQAQGWLDQVKAVNPAGFDHMPLFQATTQDRNDPTKYAGTKLTNPDIYTAANRPAIPGTLSPTSPSLSAVVTGNAKALGNLGAEFFNRALDLAVGDAGKSGHLPQFTLTPDENAAAQATGIMALPFGAEDIVGLLSPKKVGSVGGESVGAGSQGAGAGQTSAGVGPAQNASGDLNAAGNAARNQPYGNGASASPSPGTATAGSSGTSVQLPSATNAGALTTAEQMAILREAAAGGSLGKGNFSLGQATADEANELGAAWVGPGYRISSDGSSWVSSDGLKIYRPPSAKPNSSYATTGVQANFESKLTSGSRPISNGHLNITP